MRPYPNARYARWKAKGSAGDLACESVSSGLGGGAAGESGVEVGKSMALDLAVGCVSGA
jgi:hypothetical protein